MVRFDVTQVQITVSGQQYFTADAHLITRGRRQAEMVTVSAGNLVVYCYDLDSVRAFATTCRTASRFLPVGFAKRHLGPEGASDTNAVGLVLRVEGTPTKSRVNGMGAAYGVPHVRVELDRLVVRFLDQAALTSWATGWAKAETLAQRIWPPDAFQGAGAAARLRIARTGRLREPTPAG